MTLQLSNLDRIAIWLCRLVVISLPIMLFNPMSHFFHRLQLTEILFIPTLLLFLWSIFTRKIILPMPNKTVWLVLLFILVCIVSALNGLAPRHALLETGKLIYLFVLAMVLYSFGNLYHLRQDLIKWMGYGYLLILLGGIVGIILLSFNIPSFLAYRSKIILVAFNIHHWLPFIPRVSSFLQPTANMLGAYLAVMTLPLLGIWLSKPNFSKKHGVQFLFIVFVGALGLLTMSRTFVGVLLAIALTIWWFCEKWPLRRLLAALLIISAGMAWLILLFFSTLYPIKSSIAYQNFPHYRKDKVLLHDNRWRSNPVYYFRKNVGLEQWDVKFAYGINHYLWLKYGGVKIFLAHPWLGVGLGNYPKGMQQLAVQDIVPHPLEHYRSAQSQYATLLAETGVLGTLVYFALILSLIILFYRRYKRYQNKYDLCVWVSLLILLLIAIDIDVLSFRWLWGFIAISLLPAQPRQVEVELTSL